MEPNKSDDPKYNSEFDDFADDNGKSGIAALISILMKRCGTVFGSLFFLLSLVEVLCMGGFVLLCAGALTVPYLIDFYEGQWGTNVTMEFWGTEPEMKRTLWPDGWDEGTYWTWTKSYPDGRDYGRPLTTGRRVCGWEEGHATLLVAADTRPVLDTYVGQLSSRAKKNDGTV